MAKGNQMLGLVKGKLGDIVGYRVTNSNDKVKQGWRPYRAHISNPKSFLQASQRVKINNITRNYGQLKEVIARGFEGIKYGGLSYQEFLRLNMLNVPDGPWVEKGYITPVPAAYQISRGSLPTIGMRWDSTQDSFISNLQSTPPEAGNTVTLSAFTTKLITANPWIQDGDQLTWIGVFEYEGGAFEYRFASVTLDTTNVTTNLVVTAKGQIGIGNYLYINNDASYIVDPDSGLEDETLVAAACIQSRDGGNDPLRSSEILGCNTAATTFYTQFFGAAAKRAAILSFMAEGSDIDWPVEQIPGTTSLQGTRSAAPAPAVEPDTRTTKKKTSKE